MNIFHCSIYDLCFRVVRVKVQGGENKGNIFDVVRRQSKWGGNFDSEGGNAYSPEGFSMLPRKLFTKTVK